MEKIFYGLRPASTGLIAAAGLGVAKIALYRRESGWKRIATTTERSFLDTDVTAGGTFTYTIRALNANLTKYTSNRGLPTLREALGAAESGEA